MFVLAAEKLMRLLNELSAKVKIALQHCDLSSLRGRLRRRAEPGGAAAHNKKIRGFDFSHR